MAKTKNVRLVSPEQGLTTYCSVTFIPSDPDIPSSYLDAVDMKFRITPTTAYHDLTESTKVPGTYELSDSTIEWQDGFYKFDFWSQLGGSKAPTTDDILTVTQNRIKITQDTIYATFQVSDAHKVARSLTGAGTTNYTITLTTADTEYSQVLPNGAKHVFAHIRDGSSSNHFRVAWEAGKVATPTDVYTKIDGNGYYSTPEGIVLNLQSKTIYFAGSVDGLIVQLEVTV